MIRAFRLLSLLVLLMTGFASCEKEYSEENGGSINGGGTQSGTAVFTLAGAPGGCTTPSIVGTYTAGTALTASEKITLIVDVTTIGTYTISTGTANGVSFTGSGTFSATGQQFIELSATGSTPASAGTFTYVPGTAGCSFTITYVASTGTSSGTAVYTLKGAPDDCTAPVITGTFTAGTPLTSASSIQVTAIVTTPGTYAISTGTANGVKFSGSGTFTATGEFPITLTSTDTPTSQASNVAYTPGTNGCSFTITFAAATTTTDYLRCKTAGGALTNFSEGLEAQRQSVLGVDLLEVSGSSTAGALLSISVSNLMGSLSTGTYSLPSASNFTMVANPVYSDGTNNWAGANNGQSGTFTVVVTALTSNRVTGTFSGTLYDNSGQGTNTLAVTEGAFSVAY